jgi:hypothetical protein
MRITIAAATLLAAATLTAQASPGNPAGRMCVARVLQSEELPYAPIHYWLVKVRLEITPPDGPPYEIALQDRMPWQGPPPRRGQSFRVLCDPANPNDLHAIR